jgi:hypothetical protein
MKKITFILFFALAAITTKSQTLDTLDYVNHYGVVFPVLEKASLSNPELKKIVKPYPEAHKEFKRMRMLKHAEIALFVVSMVPLIYAIGAESEQQFWIGLGLSAVISGVSYALINEPYNRRMRKTIEVYNKLKVEEFKK